MMSAALTILVFGGCSPARKSPPPPANVTAPSTRFIFQPVFEWKGNRTRPYATGFFGRDPDGRIAAVTCSSLLKRRGRPVVRICWQNIGTRESVHCFTKSWGPPGKGGVTDIHMREPDLRTDYFILRTDQSIPNSAILDLDDRSLIETGERVWFPNKNQDSRIGYDLITGYIRDSHLSYHVLTLDQPIRVASQSGTPVISQLTGRVIGILSRDGRMWGRNTLGEDRPGTFFLLAPASKIVAAMAAYDTDIDFSEIFGQGRD